MYAFIIPGYFSIKWLNSSRLETRTEEFGIYASGNDAKSCPQNESEWYNIQGLYIPIVNYGCKISNCNMIRVKVYVLRPERLWTIPELIEVKGNFDGRSPTVMTCKSLVKVGYRGERLIEQSG